MALVRIYTGADGESHFEELKLRFDPADVTKRGLYNQKSSGASFRREPPGHFQDWHIAPRRQYVVTLVGTAEIEIGSGEKRRFGPGDVLLADDLTGHGHITRVVSSVPRISLAIPLAE